MELEGSETSRNLHAALAAEAEANCRYLWFAEQADVEGFPKMAAIFRSIAEKETGHAMGHLEYLSEVGDPTTGQPIGDTADNLRSAIVGEEYESGSMYVDFANTARDEGFEEIADWFVSLVGAEKRNAEQFTAGLGSLG
ncbi:MAG: rubrerythrin [Candidatus Poriferisodalaceae bacterium]|jgi:rubrerythrin